MTARQVAEINEERRRIRSAPWGPRVLAYAAATRAQWAWTEATR